MALNIKVKNSDKKALWVVVPALNEERVVGDVVRDLLHVVQHVVLVDDGSSDGTSDLALRYTPHVIRHAQNEGQGAALRTGIQYALKHGADIVVTFDADGQMLPDDISGAVEILSNGELDAVLGTRFSSEAVQGMPLIKKFLSRALALIFELFLNSKLTDTNNGFRVFSRETAERLPFRCNGMAHALEIIIFIMKNNLRYREVPVRIRYTPYSIKKGQRLIGIFHIFYELLFARNFR